MEMSDRQTVLHWH